MNVPKQTIKPKFILSKTKVLEQFNKVKELADYVSYSSKTNQDVTKILEDNINCFFSVHFQNELKHIKDLSRVIFLAQGWNKNEIRSLVEKKINWFVVDNESDLDVLLDFLEKEDLGNKNKDRISNERKNKPNRKINLLLRIKLKELTLKTGKFFVFGMKSKVVNRRIREIKNNEKLKNKIKELGIHFHRKTQNMSEWNYKYEIASIVDNDVLELLDIVNMGGGLPSEYANTNVDVLPSIFNEVTEFKKWLNQHNIKLMIEPGRFIAAPAGKLVTKIVGIHDNNIIVNASVYNSDLDALIVPVKLLVEGELLKREGEPYVIKGITPCSMDLFRYRVYLNNPQVGDELVFLNAGAYNFTTNFCDLDEIETEVRE